MSFQKIVKTFLECTDDVQVDVNVWKELNLAQQKQVWGEIFLRSIPRCETSCEIQESLHSNQQIKFASISNNVPLDSHNFPIVLAPIRSFLDFGFKDSTFSADLLASIISVFSSYFAQPFTDRALFTNSEVLSRLNIVYVDVVKLFVRRFMRAPNFQKSLLERVLIAIAPLISHPEIASKCFKTVAEELDSVNMRLEGWTKLNCLPLLRKCWDGILESVEKVSHNIEIQRLEGCNCLLAFLFQMQRMWVPELVLEDRKKAKEVLTTCFDRIIKTLNMAFLDDKLLKVIEGYLTTCSRLPILTDKERIEMLMKYHRLLDSRNRIPALDSVCVQTLNFDNSKQAKADLLETSGALIASDEVGLGLQIQYFVFAPFLSDWMVLCGLPTINEANSNLLLDVILAPKSDKESEERSFFLKSVALRALGNHADLACILAADTACTRRIIQAFTLLMSQPKFLWECSCWSLSFPENLAITLIDTLPQTIRQILIGIRSSVYQCYVNKELVQQIAEKSRSKAQIGFFLSMLLRPVLLKPEIHKPLVTMCWQTALELLTQVNSISTPILAALPLKQLASRAILRHGLKEKLTPKLLEINEHEKEYEGFQNLMNEQLLKMLLIIISDVEGDWPKQLEVSDETVTKTAETLKMLPLSTTVCRNITVLVASYLPSLNDEQAKKVLKAVLPALRLTIMTNLDMFVAASLGEAWRPCFDEFPVVEYLFDALADSIDNKRDLIRLIQCICSKQPSVIPSARRRWFQVLPSFTDISDEDNYRSYVQLFHILFDTFETFEKELMSGWPKISKEMIKELHKEITSGSHSVVIQLILSTKNNKRKRQQTNLTEEFLLDNFDQYSSQ